MNKEIVDARLGCIFGALVGDAAGAYLEFIGHKPSPEEVEKAMTMPGGGIWELAPGQITDDGELTLCLDQALREGEKFDRENIAAWYNKWYASRPFDIGNTTSASIGCPQRLSSEEFANYSGYADAMTQSAKKNCMNSKANGSLMRATPLAAWAWNRSDAEIALFAKLDSSLSHPNDSCWQAVAAYCIAIAELISSNDRNKAWSRTSNWIKNNANKELNDWAGLIENNQYVPGHPQAGFVKIAFVHAFQNLLKGNDYHTAIRSVLEIGGDTDTNACIVGGLIGAAVGFENIPEKMRNTVLTCDTSKGAHPRPDFLHPANLFLLNSDTDNGDQKDFSDYKLELLKEVQLLPILSKSDKVTLCKRVEWGDCEAARLLIEGNKSLVLEIALALSEDEDTLRQSLIAGQQALEDFVTNYKFSKDKDFDKEVGIIIAEAILFNEIPQKNKNTEAYQPNSTKKSDLEKLEEELFRVKGFCQNCQVKVESNRKYCPDCQRKSNNRLSAESHKKRRKAMKEQGLCLKCGEKKVLPEDIATYLQAIDPAIANIIDPEKLKKSPKCCKCFIENEALKLAKKFEKVAAERIKSPEEIKAEKQERIARQQRNNRERRHKILAENPELCTHCLIRVKAEGKKHCETCLERYNANAQARIDERRAKGLCVFCGKDSQGKQLCDICAQRQNINSRAWRRRERQEREANGLCVSCGKVPPESGRKSCHECNAIAAQQNRESRMRRKKR